MYDNNTQISGQNTKKVRSGSTLLTEVRE